METLVKGTMILMLIVVNQLELEFHVSWLCINQLSAQPIPMKKAKKSHGMAVSARKTMPILYTFKN